MDFAKLFALLCAGLDDRSERSLHAKLAHVEAHPINSLFEQASSALKGGCTETANKLGNVIIDFCKDKINQTHWKDVPEAWRIAYSAGSLVKAFSIWMDIQQATDKGLMLSNKKNINSQKVFRPHFPTFSQPLPSSHLQQPRLPA